MIGFAAACRVGCAVALAVVLASGAASAEKNPSFAPAADNALMKPASADNATVAGKKPGKSKTAPRIVLVEDNSIRIMGYTPRQFLWLSVGAIVLFNIVGAIVLTHFVRKARRED